jgi:hypothetical protein
LSFEPVAVAIHLQNVDMMGEAAELREALRAKTVRTIEDTESVERFASLRPSG